MATRMGDGNRISMDRQNLATFLINVNKVLGLIVEFRKILLPSYMIDEFNSAWPEVEKRIDKSVNILRGIDPFQPFWPSSEDFILSSEDLDDRLIVFGLTGDQLKLKLTVFYHYYNQVMDDPEFFPKMGAPAQNNAQIAEKKRKSWIFRKLLAVMNSILGSLSRAIPIVDWVKEFKEMAEHGNDLAEEDWENKNNRR